MGVTFYEKKQENTLACFRDNTNVIFLTHLTIS